MIFVNEEKGSRNVDCLLKALKGPKSQSIDSTLNFSKAHLMSVDGKEMMHIGRNLLERSKKVYKGQKRVIQRSCFYYLLLMN